MRQVNLIRDCETCGELLQCYREGRTFSCNSCHTCQLPPCDAGLIDYGHCPGCKKMIEMLDRCEK